VRGRAAKTVALFLVASAISCGAAELVWRANLYRTGRGFFDDPREFTSPFFTTFDEPRPIVFGSELYYRNGKVARDKGPREIRVICLGGSTTVNFRAGISFPELLEGRLAARGSAHEVRVLNAGSEGYSTAHLLVNLSLRNLDAQPDIVVVFENINDLSAMWFGDEVASDYANKYKTDFYLGFRHRTGVIASVAKISRLARFAFSRIQALEFPRSESRERSSYDRGLTIFTRNLRNLVAVSQANRVRLLLASQPARSDFRAHPGFAAYNRTIEQVAAETGVAFVDLARIVTDDRFFLDDAIHNNRAGVEAVAEALYRPLVAMADEVARERGVARDSASMTGPPK
jgi:lysophospholipase L1-like esterase